MVRTFLDSVRFLQQKLIIELILQVQVMFLLMAFIFVGLWNMTIG